MIDSSLQTKDDFELWTCENPNLYDFSVSLFLSKEDLENQNTKDKIESYFGLREISVKEINGVKLVVEETKKSEMVNV